MQKFVLDPEAPILVEFPKIGGLKEVCITDSRLEEQSNKAINNAMNIIYNTARRISDTIESLKVKPSSVEVSFGVTVNAETGALIAKCGIDTTFDVKLIWEQS